MRRILHFLRLSVGFLTLLPVGIKTYEPGDLARASPLFPLVGAGVGITVWGVRFLAFTRTQDSLLAALCALFAWVAFTRGFHLDGVADVCDALFAGGGVKERRLVLKDPRVGTFGVLGILLVLGTKGVLLSQVEHFLPLLLAPVFGRVVVLLLGASFLPPLRESEGLAEEFVGKVPKEAFFLWAGGFCILGFFAGGWVIVLKTFAGFGIMFALGKVLSQRFGGLSGDVLGAGIEWGETLWLFLLRV